MAKICDPMSAFEKPEAFSHDVDDAQIITAPWRQSPTPNFSEKKLIIETFYFS
jgi:hypothetical protein